MTAALSAICGTHFGETKAPASTTGRPASARRSMSAIFVVGRHRLRLVLQPVARADLDHLDAGGEALRHVERYRWQKDFW